MQVKVDELMLVGFYAKFVSLMFLIYILKVHFWKVFQGPRLLFHLDSQLQAEYLLQGFLLKPDLTRLMMVPTQVCTFCYRVFLVFLWCVNHCHGSISGENHYQSHSVGHSGDVEFIDPAILAVGKSRIPVEPNSSTLGLKSFPARFVTSDNDPRFHLLSQQMISSHQNTRMPDMEETFWPLNDAFAASRLLAQSHTRFSPLAQLSHQQPRNPLYSNSHWDAWNNLRTAADMGMGEVFRNERIGLNDYYKSTPENKFHMPSASDLYSRAFGM